MLNYYKIYITSDEWKKKREEIIEIKGRKCEKCGSTENILVHHGSYLSLGFEELRHVFVLCSSCHNLFHKTYGINDLYKATSSFINGTKYIQKKQRARKTLEERRKNRKPRKTTRK